MELTKKLKKLHGQHLTANTASWTMWANSIHSAPAHKRKTMLNEMPPPHLIHLFRLVPIAEAEILRSAQNGLQMVGNLNGMYTENIQSLRAEFQKMKETSLRMYDMYEMRLQATEDMLAAYNRLVDSMGARWRWR